jgi:phospholipid/cholesterol/gamma-HCH transport system substrate-binding protein
VLLAGVQVGYVEKVELNPKGFLDVTMSVDKQWKIPEGTTALVQNEGFFGDKSIALKPCLRTAALPKPGAPAPLCYPSTFMPTGDTIPAGVAAPNVDELIGRVDSMSTALSTIVQAVRLQMVQEGGIKDLRQTIASTNALVAQLNKVAADQSRGLTLTLNTLRRSVSALDSTAIDSTVHNMQAASANMAALTRNLQETSTHLNSVMAKVETGNGTVARLLDDPGVYNELRGSLARLDSLLADVKANPKRYINVKVF